MSQDESDGADNIAGLSLSDAVDAVVATVDALDRETARAVLATITEDGVVSRDAVDAALADASMAVSNAESRAEMAAVRLADVRESAADAPDLDAIRTRVDAFESDVAAIEERASDLGATLQELVGRKDDPASLYDLAAEIEQLTEEAGSVHATAEELRTDLESFEEWLADSNARLRELERDLDVIEQSIEALGENVDELASLVAGDRDHQATDDDLAGAWLELSVTHRVRELGLMDARAELADLRTWAADDDGDAEGYGNDAERRLDELEDQWRTLGDRIDDVAPPAWRDRFEDRRSAVEDALDGFEPPIDFGAVQAELEKHRLE
ncbi:halo transducer protein [Halorientalis brevis]|uniref:Halo transducer protein n=1 Tax=Halorientalis brevis TaxID=1126241 RepID=A0ABD6C699_9EURY|nr:hypothetical protein [Halorientalis brevis]